MSVTGAFHQLHCHAEAQYDGGKRAPATISAIVDAVRWAEEGIAARGKMSSKKARHLNRKKHPRVNWWPRFFGERSLKTLTPVHTPRIGMPGGGLPVCQRMIYREAQISIVKFPLTRRKRRTKVVLVAISEDPYERHLLSLSYGG
jgi:hypothetical protein